MRMVLLSASLMMIVVAAQPALAQNAFAPDQVKYVAAPPSLSPGAQLAVLEGDPAASSGDYTVRLRMPAGFKIAPHWHPKRENVTVLSGNLRVGMGDAFQESKMMDFGAGSFAYLDPEMHHYAMAGTDTVIQIHGMSPLQINYVHPEDDPSRKQGAPASGGQ